MIKLEAIEALRNDEGVTLKKGEVVVYKSGYQVATEGVEVTTATEALEVVKAMDGNCGIWLSEGVYYIDKCHRVSLKRDAIAEGLKCNQQSIYGWKRSELVWLNR